MSPIETNGKSHGDGSMKVKTEERAPESGNKPHAALPPQIAASLKKAALVFKDSFKTLIVKWVELKERINLSAHLLERRVRLLHFRADCWFDSLQIGRGCRPYGGAR